MLAVALEVKDNKRLIADATQLHTTAGFPFAQQYNDNTVTTV
jgi:hypothetical protein